MQISTSVVWCSDFVESIAKGGRTYSVKHLCEKTGEKKQPHTRTNTHLLHKHTLKNVDKLFFSAALTSRLDTPHPCENATVFLSIKHLSRCGRAPEGPGSRRTSLTSLLPCNPKKKKKKKTDRRLVSMPQPHCQNSN